MSISEAVGGMAVCAFSFSGGNQDFIGRGYAFEEFPGSFFTMVYVAPVGADGLDARIEETDNRMSALALAARGGTEKAETEADGTTVL